MSGYKACIQCGESYPATPANFHKSKDGYHARCRKCRNARLKGERKQVRNRRLAKIEKSAIDAFIKASRLGGANIPHSSELTEVIMEYFGGVRGFANAFMKQFYDSPVGGAFRTKMLDSVVRLVKDNTAMGGSKKPLELMSEEELEAELRRQVLEAALTIQKVEVVDGHSVPNLPLVAGGVEDIRQVPEIPADSGPGQQLLPSDRPH